MKPRVECAREGCGKPQLHEVHQPSMWDHDFEDPRLAGLQPIGKAKQRFNRSPAGKQYNARTRELAKGETLCQILSPVCSGIAKHQHEPLSRGRAGGIAASLRDGPRPIDCCDECNDYCSLNPVWARERGLLFSVRDISG